MAAQDTALTRSTGIIAVPAAIERALIENDLSGLSTEARLSYYKQVCETVGLNPLTQPLGYLKLNGKTVLYAKKDATDQLRKIHGVSVTKLENQRIDDVYVVTAYGMDKTGRTDSATGAVTIGAMKGDNLANALMKAETKSKRRLTLSICGLGILDETELTTIPGAVTVPEQEPATTINITVTIEEEKSDDERYFWLCKNGKPCIVYAYATAHETQYKRLLDMNGRTVSLKVYDRGIRSERQCYELAEVVKVEAINPVTNIPAAGEFSDFTTTTGPARFEGDYLLGVVTSIDTKLDKNKKEYRVIQHSLRDGAKNVYINSFHKSLDQAVTDCKGRFAVLKVKLSGAYLNLEDVMSIDGVAYKDGKILEAF